MQTVCELAVSASSEEAALLWNVVRHISVTWLVRLYRQSGTSSGLACFHQDEEEKQGELHQQEYSFARVNSIYAGARNAYLCSLSGFHSEASPQRKLLILLPFHRKSVSGQILSTAQLYFF